MSVTRTGLGHRGYIAVTVAIVGMVAAAIAVFGAIAPASAAPVSFAFNFGTVQPGEVHSDADTLTLPVDAVVAEVESTPPISPELGVFRVELCSASAGCASIDTLPGTRLAAGDYTLQVRLGVADTVTPGAHLSTAGRISFTEEAGDLAVTGSDGWAVVAWIGGALLVGGAAALAIGAIARRKRDRS